MNEEVKFPYNVEKKCFYTRFPSFRLLNTQFIPIVPEPRYCSWSEQESGVWTNQGIAKGLESTRKIAIKV